MTSQLRTTRSPERAWGETVFAGTRVPVQILYDYLAAGETLAEFLRQFPSVSAEQALAGLAAREKRLAGGLEPG